MDGVFAEGEAARDEFFVVEKKFGVSFFVEVGAAVVRAEPKVGGREDFPVEKGKGECVDAGAKGLEQIERQRSATGFERVEEADGGIEAVEPESEFDFREEDGVGEGENGVGGVFRRAAGTLDERDVFREESCEAGEIFRGGKAFDAAERGERVGALKHDAQGFEASEGGRAFFREGVAVGEAADDAALVRDFREKQRDGEGEREGFAGGGGAVLGDAPGGVVGDDAGKLPDPAAAGRHQRQRDFLSTERFQDGNGNVRIPGNDDAGNVAEEHARRAFVLVFVARNDDEVLVFYAGGVRLLSQIKRRHGYVFKAEQRNGQSEEKGIAMIFPPFYKLGKILYPDERRF